MLMRQKIVNHCNHMIYLIKMCEGDELITLVKRGNQVLAKMAFEYEERFGEVPQTNKVWQAINNIIKTTNNYNQ